MILLSAIINAKHETRMKTIDSNEIEKVKEDIKGVQSNLNSPKKTSKNGGDSSIKNPLIRI